ncbi:response regulator [Zongyangia hominis]|uniref:Circadian input-output histidine kinase CikA n=1 Tax=Zongyangia hominis TaxID=2763677 RepID=A0A926EAL5_9FIRM|nr:response regulator [Zongyangia hominis]MBC8569485.1 response regulator [Zongyangia hominis]
MKTAQVEQVIYAFFHNYLELRDMEKAASYLCEEIQWIGTGEDEIARGKEEAVAVLRKEKTENPDGYRIHLYDLSISGDERMASVMGAADVTSQTEPRERVALRVTASCIRQDDGWKILSLHAYFAAAGREGGEYFPARNGIKNLREFEKRVSLQSIELLNRSIPGGMMGGYIEEGFPLYYINDRMLSYLGYTYEEFVRDIDGHVINCMHPEDAPRIDAIVGEALSRGREYEVQYRMRKKDGSYIWVNDIGKKVYDEDGRAVCISTVRDITREVEAEQGLAMKEEQFRIAAMQAGSFVFLFDPATRSIHITEEIAERYHVKAKYTGVPDDAVETGIVAPESVAEYRRIYQEIIEGAGESQGLVSMLHPLSGKTVTTELHLLAVKDTSGKTVRAVGIGKDISAYLETESRNQEIARQKKRYDHLFQSVLCGIVQYKLDASGGVVYKDANQEAIRIFGYTPEEFWKKDDWNLPSLIMEEDRERVLSSARSLINVGDKGAYEYRLRKKDGSACWIIGSAEVILDIDNEKIIQSVFLDINDKKKAEIENRKLFEQIAASNELLNISLENTTSREFYYYPQDRTITVPERTCAYYGCKAQYENMPSGFADEVVDEKYREQFCRMYHEIDNGKTWASCEFQLINGQWCRVVLSVVVQDTRQLPTVVVGIVEDITKEKHVELENIELQAIYDFAMNHDYEYLCMVNIPEHKYAIRFSDPSSFLEFPASGDFGAQKELFISHMVCPEDRERYAESLSLENMVHRLDSGEEMFQVYYRSNAPQLRHKECRICYFNGSKNTILITMRDIHDMVVREEESKQALRDAYEAANKANLAKSEFLSRMSHDIRTPMNAIVGMTAIAATHLDDQEKMMDCLSKITVSSKHLLGLINDVLDMSKIESGKIELSESEFHLADLVQSCLTIVRPSATSRQHRFDVHIKHVEHEDVIGDPMRMQQIFVNLLSNAVKYTPEGGKILFTIRELPADIKGFGCYEFVVEDNGVGIEKAFQERMFQPFERADDARTSGIQGTGLGLTITRNIVQMMYGNIQVESEPGKGSRFTVVVNLRLQHKQDHQLDQLADLPVLVADDDPLSCENAAETLRELGMRCDWVLTGADAVKKTVEAHKRKEDYFAVILDWQMPDVSGVEVTRRIRAQVGPDIPIVIISSYDWSEIEREARNAGAVAFISKPLFKSKMSMVFQKLIGGAQTEEDRGITELSQMCLEGSHLLLVEDNLLNMEIAAEIIGQTGAQIDKAIDGKEAVERFEASKEGYYDLILMDIQMPLMNGYEATRAIRALDRTDAMTIPVVAMTADAFANDVKKCREAGMDGHISKPIDMAELSAVLRKWLPNGGMEQ